jgi:hypothetical protein
MVLRLSLIYCTPEIFAGALISRFSQVPLIKIKSLDFGDERRPPSLKGYLIRLRFFEKNSENEFFTQNMVKRKKTSVRKGLTHTT